MTPAITTNGLTRSFGHHVAVDHVDFDITSGEMFGLVGPNGAGKTTLIRMLCGILEPSGGSACVLGHDLTTETAQIRPLIGYMSQAFSLYQSLTVAENLQFYGNLYGHVPAGRQQDVCHLVGLDDSDLSRQITDLPTGVRQRAALAAAVLHSPKLLFLDEPTSGVDPVGRRDFWALIRGLAAQGTTVIVTTHVMAEAERCDRVALMLDGRAFATGTPADLRATTWLPGCSRPRPAVATCIPAAVRPLAWHHPPRYDGPRAHASDVDPAAALAEQLRTVDVMSIALEQPTLEDTFIWLIRRAGFPVRRSRPPGDHRSNAGTLCHIAWDFRASSGTPN